MIKRGIIGSTLAVFFVATVLFLGIYLFVPELSISVFGVSFQTPEIINAEDLKELTGQTFSEESVKKVNEFITSAEVKELLKSGKELTQETLKEIAQDEDVKEIVDSIDTDKIKTSFGALVDTVKDAL